MIDKINHINKVLQKYFEQNKSVSIVPAKDMMPHFIKAGIFPTDQKNGLPIRDILRKLDKANQLNKIPFVYAERKLQNTNWYFRNAKNVKVAPVVAKVSATKILNKASATGSRKNSDEHYVIDLCDKVLGLVGSRQHRFDFLLGDPGKTGSRAKLPVDVYYETLSLVIEFNEQQHTKAVSHFDKPNVMTVSGVHRGEQRKIYDKRKRTVLPKNGIKVITISYDLFECTRGGKIVRSEVEDLGVVKEYLIKQMKMK